MHSTSMWQSEIVSLRRRNLSPRCSDSLSVDLKGICCEYFSIGLNPRHRSKLRQVFSLLKYHDFHKGEGFHQGNLIHLVGWNNHSYTQYRVS